MPGGPPTRWHTRPHAARRDRAGDTRRTVGPVPRRRHGTWCGRGRLGDDRGGDPGGPASPTRAGGGRRRRARPPICSRRPCRRSRRSSPASRCRPTAIPIDLDDRPRFDQVVLGAVRGIGWGETASYGEIARRVGAPRASRAVGGALGRNPISLVIPCHRVIAADGTLGGYGGDGWIDRDRELSRKEAHAAARRASRWPAAPSRLRTEPVSSCEPDRRERGEGRAPSPAPVEVR